MTSNKVLIEYKVVKRNLDICNFDKSKIQKAIMKAMKYGSGITKKYVADFIADEAVQTLYSDDKDVVSISTIENYVYDMLIKLEEIETAKAYEGYRAVQEFKRKINTSDKNILNLVSLKDKDLMNENSNKNARIASTQRDLIAGEVSKDIAKRKLIPAHIVQAHENGVLHYHDMDYAIQDIKNCCVINLRDMLENGTVINGKMVEKPKSFQTACTITTQIIAQVASGQYGGQSIDLGALAPFVRISYEKHLMQAYAEQTSIYNIPMDTEKAKKVAKVRTEIEVKAGIQTIQYQINTLATSNGQSPFVTVMLYIQDEHEYEAEQAMLVEEMLHQRMQGLKNEDGQYVTPTFPKLIYVLDENNIKESSKYWNVTQLAVKCAAKRLYPDFISAKIMKKNYEGNVFPPMGCRSWLIPYVDPTTGEYKFDGRFNQGVVTINIPQIAIIANGDVDKFWEMFDERLDLCKEALMVRHNLLKGTLTDASPIHWQHGAIARLKKGETIDKLLYDNYSTLALGYIGIYETVKLLTGKSHTEEKELALDIVRHMYKRVLEWRAESNIGFSLYGTPAESLAYRFAKIDANLFSKDIKDVTDKGYYTNSYHVDVRENINAFEKLRFESEFQNISLGGCISYIEIPNMYHNYEAMEQIVQFMYENIQYAEFNTKSDMCHTCGFDREIKLNENMEWYCPECGNKDTQTMTITRRTCGYIGANLWNEGKTREINERVLHL